MQENENPWEDEVSLKAHTKAMAKEHKKMVPVDMEALKDKMARTAKDRHGQVMDQNATTEGIMKTFPWLERSHLVGLKEFID